MSAKKKADLLQVLVEKKFPGVWKTRLLGKHDHPCAMLTEPHPGDVSVPQPHAVACAGGGRPATHRAGPCT